MKDRIDHMHTLDRIYLKSILHANCIQRLDRIWCCELGYITCKSLSNGTETTLLTGFACKSVTAALLKLYLYLFNVNTKHYWQNLYRCARVVGGLSMIAPSNGVIFRVTGHLCGEFTGTRWIPHKKGQWRGALMFSLICVWINGWVNNREAGDLRGYRAHYDITVMADVWLHHYMASLETTSRMQQCFNILINIYHEFILLFYWCVLLEIQLNTTITITVTP